MTESVVFQTSGILDLKAITIFGCSVKPRKDSPIGYFGTGLKYALAILAREDCEVTIYRGLDAPLHLSTKQVPFRGEMLSSIFLGEDELPFTTDLGKNWELWQAFRELESNTRDEEGYASSTDTIIEPEAGYTKIVITSDAFTSIYEDRDTIFLYADISDNISPIDALEIYKQPSKYLFYKGICVYKLPKPSRYTFNITEKMDLTEDRTLQYWFIAERTVARAIGAIEDYDILFSLLTDPLDFISTLDFDYDIKHDAITDSFKNAVAEANNTFTLCNDSAMRLVTAIENPTETKDTEQELTDLVEEIAGSILSTAYEPSERGAGYSCDEESLQEVKDLIKAYIDYKCVF